MKTCTNLPRIVVLACSLAAMLAGTAKAAMVEPGTGYSTSFLPQPLALDWSTRGFGSGNTNGPGEVTTAAQLDAAVGTNYASTIISRTVSSGANPPMAFMFATWSTNGYVQTRANSCAYLVLMLTLTNNTGTNAGAIQVSYDYTTNRAALAEEEVRGMRVYYSLSGTPGTWWNIPDLSQTTEGALSTEVVLADVWTNRGPMYLLWADDNGSGATDDANNIDNVSVAVTRSGTPAGSCVLFTPKDGESFVGPAAVNLIAGANAGRDATITGIGFYETTAGFLGMAPTFPYTNTLNLGLGTYGLYAVATNNLGETYFSSTNTIIVAPPLSISLTAPEDGATFDYQTTVWATSVVAGGTAPYTVQFYTNNVLWGVADSSSGLTFSKNLGSMFMGQHGITAVVMDNNGWLSTSAVHTVSISGPLFVSMDPSQSFSLNFGEATYLTGRVVGGTAPFRTVLYINGQAWHGTLPYSLFVAGLGVLPAGSYTNYFYTTDGSSPMQTAYSSTNVITILPNPVVTILTSPTAGQTVGAGTALNLTATASVLPPLSVSSVQFYFDGAPAGVDGTAPYSASVTPNVGTHTVYAAATDDWGRTFYSATNEISAIPSGPPPNDNFNSATPLSGVSATAFGYNNNASKEFFEVNHAGNNGGASVWWTWVPSVTGQAVIDTEGSTFNTLLGVYTGTAQWRLTTIASNNDYNGNPWSRVTFTANAGTTYRIGVDGYNSGSGAAVGNIVLHVRGAGGVTITTPANNMQFTYGDPIPINVALTADFPNPPASRVDFYRGNTLLGSMDEAPFNFVANGSPVGYNTFYAIAIDSLGNPMRSPDVTVLVLDVGVTLLSPADDTMFNNLNPITVTAAAAVNEGTITNVEFYVDGVKFGQDNTAPYSATWNDVVSGSHRIVAVGLSSTGASYASQPVNIGVVTTLMPFDTVWKYLDDGSDQGTAWITPEFDDSGWASGPAPLGYGDSNGRSVATPTYYGLDPNNKYPTTYFRQALVITNASAFNGFTLNIERDDGAIVYINGSELPRLNMPAGLVTYSTYASGNAGDDGTSVYNLNLSPSVFVTGTNIIAVEIHQDAPDSSDIWFQMRLLARPVIVHNISPVVALTTPTNGQYFVAPASIALEATASDADGTVANVEFFVDDVKLGEDNAAPYTYLWNTPTVGAHVVTVLATDNGGGVGSVQVPIVVYDAAGRPVVKLTYPVDGASLIGPTNLLLTASAQAITGVTNVQFRCNGIEIGNDPVAPYSFLWPAAYYSNGLTAVAYDANGLSATSAVVGIFVSKSPPVIISQSPAAGLTITNLTSISVTFSKPVQHVEAADLLINGVPATQVTPGPGASNWVFNFAHPAYGRVVVSWADDHGITDTEPEQNPFDSSRAGHSWAYTLVDQTAPAIASQYPPAGAQVTNLTQITVTFTETGPWGDRKRSAHQWHTCHQCQQCRHRVHLHLRPAQRHLCRHHLGDRPRHSGYRGHAQCLQRHRNRLNLVLSYAG